MRPTHASLCGLLAIIALAGGAAADSAKFPVKGLIKSGAQGGTGTTAVVVLDDVDEPSTAPASGKVFVLTEACFKVDAGASLTLSAGALSIAFAASNSNAGAGCQSFGTGYVVAEGVDVMCAATGVANFSCTVSGVVAKQQ